MSYSLTTEPAAPLGEHSFFTAKSGAMNRSRGVFDQTEHAGFIVKGYQTNSTGKHSKIMRSVPTLVPGW